MQTEESRDLLLRAAPFIQHRRSANRNMVHYGSLLRISLFRQTPTWPKINKLELRERFVLRQVFTCISPGEGCMLLSLALILQFLSEKKIRKTVLEV
jgi:hypothetical protein